MKRRVLIQMRKEEKKISKSDIADAFGMSRTGLNRKIDRGFIDSPLGRDKKFTLKNVENIFEKVGEPKLRLRGRGKPYFEDTINCNLLIVNGGIFLISPKIKIQRKLVLSKQRREFEEMITKYGRLDAQGLNNHIHLCECGVQNPVYQLILASQITNKWLERLKEVRPKSKVLIDWLGAVDTVICIYLISFEDEQYVNKLEEEQRVKRASITEIEL